MPCTGHSEQLRNQIVCCFKDMTVPLKHLSSANGFTAPSLPFLSSSPRPPAHLSIISPLDLHSLSLHLALLFFHTCTFFSDFICPSFLCLFIPLSLLSMFHLLFIFPFVLRFPTLLLQPSNLSVTRSLFSFIQSVILPPQSYTHTLCPLISRQPKPHLTLVNAPIERLLIYAYRWSE